MFRSDLLTGHEPASVGTAGIPAGVLRADCHAGKDAGGPRFRGSFHRRDPEARWPGGMAFGQTFNVERSTSNVQPTRPLKVES